MPAFEMAHNLIGKRVLITGASTGIGRAVAEELIGKAAYLFLAARRTDLLEEIKAANSESETIIEPIRCDVSVQSEVDRAYQVIKEKVGSIDIAILNAGIGFNMKPENYDYKWADKIIGTNFLGVIYWVDKLLPNFLGVIYWVDKLLPDFLDKKSGIIAATSSVADNRGYSGSGFYCASKAALTNYLEGLRIELRNYNIKVITIRPGFVKTHLTDKNKFIMPFMLSPEKAAKKIVSGIQKGKRVIQFPWQMIFITRLIGALPGGIYEFLERFGPKH
jgi:short-subunit dehydrogenase